MSIYLYKLSICINNFFHLIAVPTYCWTEAEIEMEISAAEFTGDTSAQFMFSINRSGAEFPNYISEQCAEFSIHPSTGGKLERAVCHGTHMDVITLQFVILCTSPKFKYV